MWIFPLGALQLVVGPIYPFRGAIGDYFAKFDGMSIEVRSPPVLLTSLCSVHKVRKHLLELRLGVGSAPHLLDHGC